jgi:hypothetical protein
MQENKDNIKDLAGKALRNFEVQPPSSLWAKIESGIARRRRKILIFRYSSIAASFLLLIGLGIGYLNYNENIDTREKLIASKTENNKPDNKETTKPAATSGNTATDKGTTGTKTTTDKSATGKNTSGNAASGTVSGKVAPANASPDKAGKTNTNPAGIKKSQPAKPARAKEMPVRNQTNLTAQQLEQQPDQIALQNQNNLITNENDQQNIRSSDQLNSNTGVELAAEQPVAETQSQEIAPAVTLPQIITPSADLAIVTPDYSSPDAGNDKNSSWSLALGYGLSSGADFTGEGDALEDGGRGYSHDPFTAAIANETSYFEEVENTIHDAPLSIGFTVDKQLSRRLSFETGLIYTRLKFRVKTNELDPYYKEYRNELTYLGIPAGIRYSFVQKKKYDFYLLQWAVLEKGISGIWFTDTYNNDVIESSESNKDKIRGIQLSSITGIGAQYKMAGKFYLFGQGGMQVFYLNKTQPYNLRSTKTVWPSIQAGIRMKLD